MANPWFRLYSEFASDPVVQSLSFEDQRHFVVVLCLKCSEVIDRKISKPAKERIIRQALDLDEKTCAQTKKNLMEIGLIDEKWQPLSWETRQYISDKSTERVRKYRKTKGIGNVSVTEEERSCNGHETRKTFHPEKPQKNIDSYRPKSLKTMETGNGPDTEAEAESDPEAARLRLAGNSTSSDTSFSSHAKPVVPPSIKRKGGGNCLTNAQKLHFDEFWSCWPTGKKRSKGRAEKAWKALAPDKVLFDEILTGLACSSVSEDWLKEGGKYIPHPATWLNSKGWLDDHGERDYSKDSYNDLSEAGRQTALAAEQFIREGD